MGRPRQFSPEVRERAVRLVFDHEHQHDSQWAAIRSVAEKIGCTAETLRPWVRHAERDVGRRRCCTNRHGPARCPPTGSSPAEARRHWSAEGGHPIQDLTAEDGLTLLPSWTPGAKASSDDGRVAEARVLHLALTRVP